MASNKDWDQRRTLAPPPYEGPWKNHVTKGLNIGDPLLDSDFGLSSISADINKSSDTLGFVSTTPQRLSAAAELRCQDRENPQEGVRYKLLCHGFNASKGGEEHDACPETNPPWADWDAVKRGQALWQKHMLRAAMSLGMSLLVGLSIARFAEVLEYSGYGKDALTSLKRYRQTFFHWLDWFRFALDDSTSRSRRSIFAVRRVHAFARKMMTKSGKWNVDAAADQNGHKDMDTRGIGVPLSQFDVAEVQLAFTGICIDIFCRELSFGKEYVTESEKADMVHCWRVIGYFLGLLDEYNICNSLPELEAYMDEFCAFNELRVDTARPCSFKLRDAAVEGFGLWSGMGIGLYRGLFAVSTTSKRLTKPADVTDKLGMSTVNRGSNYLCLDTVAESVAKSTGYYSKKRFFGLTWSGEKGPYPWFGVKYFSMRYVRWICSLPVKAENIGKFRDIEINDREFAWKFVEKQMACARLFDRFFWERLAEWAFVAGSVTLSLGVFVLRRLMMWPRPKIVR